MIMSNIIPKKYATISGIILDKKIDSFSVQTNDYSKLIKVNEDGTFKDTLKVDYGFCILNIENKMVTVFMKNGFDVKVSLNPNNLYESLEFSGSGQLENNYLAKSQVLENRYLKNKSLENIDLNTLKDSLINIKNILYEFYDTNEKIDTMVSGFLKRSLKWKIDFYDKEISKKIQLKEGLTKGTPSPVFENYENYKGGTSSLSDFKGKYVYIDVWATWCGPCKAEIPSLKKLEETFRGKNIQFISLSVDDDRSHKGSWDKAKEAWKTMVNEKQLTGIQLIASKGWESQFIVDYKIQGIPRFLLIDPDGNILDHDAYRPSDPQLEQQLNKLLN